MDHCPRPIRRTTLDDRHELACLTCRQEVVVVGGRAWHLVPAAECQHPTVARGRAGTRPWCAICRTDLDP